MRTGRWGRVARAARAGGPALAGLLGLPGSSWAPWAPWAAGGPDFAHEVWPILERSCHECHGAERQKGGLRLDARAAAFAGSRFGTRPVLAPGRPEESLLYRRITSADPFERMPAEGEPLSAGEAELVRAWIAAGAAWPAEVGAPDGPPRHWAYVAPVRPPLPAQGSTRARNALDLFVEARLSAAGLTPAPEADRRTLIRRLSLDLVGLPPTPAEVAAFEGDAAPDAYERLVERLLASPHYGEHMASAWLDLARYADTHGYEKDERRTMWRYRDWVIEAFARDLSFDRFTIEQLAGDLLPEPTTEQLVATGFHRNTMVNQEGGTDPEEFRVAAVVDRVNTTAQVWLGTTMACVQCHDHKFDPFSQREYYALLAFFDSTEDVGDDDAPRIEAPTPEQLARRTQIEAEVADLELRLATPTPELEAELAGWEAEHRSGLREWRTLRPARAAASGGSRLAVLDDDSVLAFGDLPATDVYELEAPLEPGVVRGLRLEVLTDPSLPGGGPGRPSHANFVLNELAAWLVAPGAPERRIVLARAEADFSQTRNEPWPEAGTLDGDPRTGWAIAEGEGRPHQVLYELAEPLELAAPARLRLRLEQGFGGGHLIGRLRLSTSAEAPPARCLPPDVEALVARGAARDAEEGRRLLDWYAAQAPALAPTRARLAVLRAELVFPTALVMRELAEPRETRVHLRGSFLAPGERVGPDVPRILPPLELGPGRRATRLDLARWLVDGRNPLVARVTVNRLWERIFGRGLVASSEDFGTQGEPPSHPELLDWLALELVDGGWSVKQLLRTIVGSATYRQSAAVTEALRERDPENRLLARGPRLRLSAEGVRDAGLAISGLFSPRVGGPSVVPPQPEGTWAMTYSSDRWEVSAGEDRWRRGLYTFWRRTSPYPSSMLFDATSRELACARRERSNTPLQALVLLNDPVWVELSLALARRIVREGGAEPESRAAYGLELCTSRRAEPAELAALVALYAGERARFAADPAQAAALVTAGPASFPGTGGDELDPVELAAWGVVANALLALDETITKG